MKLKPSAGEGGSLRVRGREAGAGGTEESAEQLVPGRRTHRPACQEGCWEPPLTVSIALEVWALQGAHTKQDVVCVF